MISRKVAIQILAAAAILLIARLAVDLEYDFGQNVIAIIVFAVVLPCVLMFALVCLYRRRFLEGLVLLVICYVPLSFNNVINRQFWKFSIHKSAYQSSIQTDPGPPPKYRVFNWGNRNTQLWGGGFIIEGIVYDESDDLARWSPEWIVRRSDPLPEDRWIINPPEYPSCKRRIEPFGEHFYYVSDEC